MSAMIIHWTGNARSMTGQGHASRQTELGTFFVELRTVNNRGFKCALRSSDALTPFDSRIESLARNLIHRGSVNLAINWKRPVSETLPRIDHQALAGYFEQLQAARAAFGSDGVMIDLAQLTMLPGVVVQTQENVRDNADVWQAIEQTIQEAIKSLNSMRDQEGANMAASLRSDCALIRAHLDKIAELAPLCIELYQKRLESKIQRVLAEHDIEIQKIDLLKEVQLFADRADFSEEITRLGSHLQMFLGTLDGVNNDTSTPEPTGRKLEFIIQEMLRETNTIGSKASQVEVSSNVVDIKCAIERMRELVQNLE